MLLFWLRIFACLGSKAFSRLFLMPWGISRVPYLWNSGIALAPCCFTLVARYIAPVPHKHYLLVETLHVVGIHATA
jgi:hypothetical protein